MAVKEEKAYTVADVFAEASKMLKSEMSNLKEKPLTKTEEIKMEQFARALSKTVLKEMKIV
ncbi:MAG: hypothetical protein ABH823_01125 [bacterium]